MKAKTKKKAKPDLSQAQLMGDTLKAAELRMEKYLLEVKTYLCGVADAEADEVLMREVEEKLGITEPMADDYRNKLYMLIGTNSFKDSMTRIKLLRVV